MTSPINVEISEEKVSKDGKEIVLKIVKLTGQLDESNVDDSAHQVYELIDNMPKSSYLVFDLAELTYLNSKSIGYLTDWHLKVKEKEGEIFLVGTRSNILDILNVVGLTQIVKSYESLDVAKKALEG